MTNTYWNSNGKFQAQYEVLVNELMPLEGKADTLNGELLRAIGKVYYDFFNNGACNNTSGPCKFLISKLKNVMPENIVSDMNALYAISNTDGYTLSCLEEALENVCDFVIEYVINTPNQPNFEDMWDLQDEDANCGYSYDWDDEDESYYDDED